MQAWRKRFDALLFDLDGTLVETAPDLTGALNRTLAEANLPSVGLNEVRHMIGDGARKLLERAVANAGQEVPEADLERWFETLLAHYWHHIADESLPFPGVVSELDAAVRAGARLAVCTNKPIHLTERLLDILELSRHFNSVLGGDSLAVRKPDPRHLLQALENLHVAPERAVMIGDSANDVNAARNAGLPVVLVSFGYTQTPVQKLGADAVIDHFAELPEALAGLA